MTVALPAKGVKVVPSTAAGIAKRALRCGSQTGWPRPCRRAEALAAGDCAGWFPSLERASRNQRDAEPDQGAVGMEQAEQPVLLDHLAEPLETRYHTLLSNEEAE